MKRLKVSQKFATGAGQGAFNIVVNGGTMASNVDIFAQAGGGSWSTVSATSAMSIQFVLVVGGPKIDAIAIF
jgi:hypothetical protein